MPKRPVRTIVLFSAVPWDGVFARPQQLARGFVANGARILFVEPSASLLAPLKRKESAKFPFGSAPRFTEDALAVVTPPLVLPGGYSWRAVNKLNQRYLARFLRGTLEALGWQPTGVLTHLPGTADFPAPWPQAYDCVDDHAAFADMSPLWRRQVVLAMEQGLLRRARCVYASSDALVRRCQRIRPDTRYVGNGAAVAHFAAAARGKTGVSGLTGPVIGFYGGLGPWVDVALVREAALLAPELSFLLIGPKELGVPWPDMPPNVHYRGLTPYSELPRYLADFDVAMIPFKDTQLTQSVNPIKLYEYFAAGKPVLVTAIPELTRWEGLVYPFSTAEELVSSARISLTEVRALAAKRQAVAAQHTWEAKVREMEDLMRVHGM
ncbi:MAG: putative teichuronic acid biosynthesis glycosyltransferase TuaH [Firmicutes bacterium]|nr:putative teichuronic acid biosynthesis glycosyltransferase TuaH [candidate division NPL-UPA2 bacterium]